MQPNEKALTWQAVIKQIRHLDIPEAITYTMAQGYSQQDATDLVMDYQKNRLKPVDRKNEPKFTDSEFFREVLKKHNGGDGYSAYSEGYSPERANNS